MYEKPAQTRFPLLDPLARRWSPVGFAAQRVSPTILGSLFEAARWAPSSYNEQPWRFLVVTADKPTEFEHGLACLVPANQEWARHAAVLVLTVYATKFERNDKPNHCASYDLGQAVAMLVVQATAMGLAAHQMGGILPDEVRSRFSVPVGFDPITAIALGYPGDPHALPKHLADRDLAPRGRRALDTIVYGPAWGQPFAWDEGHTDAEGS